ncbi:MAG TPA: methyltransferase domain-containing protein [Verrucomicrobiae bacterium]|nr:methyltransferase domain-containing protein [Verrucomicrobiae bacterium]
MLPEQATQHYRGAEGQRYHREKRALPEFAFPWVSRLRAEKLAAHIQPSDVVLEYGVGAGWNLAGLKCERKIGFDVSAFLAPSLRERGIEFVPDTAALPDASIHVVICHHTLEHTIAPAAVLGEIRRLLRPGGKLLLFTPFEYEPRYEHFDPAEPNHHLYSWNVQTLGNLVTECGFSVQQAGAGQFGYSRFAAVWAGRLHLRETGFRGLRRLLHFLRPGMEARIVAIKPL